MIKKIQNYLDNTGLNILIDRYEKQDRESHTSDEHYQNENSGEPWYFGFQYNDVYFDGIFWSGIDIHEQFQECISDDIK